MMDDNRICPNQPYGKHIVVRCEGCNSIHSTKNIGSVDPITKRVALMRSLFDILGTFCLCTDPTKTALIHDCKIDDNIDYAFPGIDIRKGQHQAKTQEAREILQSWYRKFAETKSMEPTQADLDALVILVP